MDNSHNSENAESFKSSWSKKLKQRLKNDNAHIENTKLMQRCETLKHVWSTTNRNTALEKGFCWNRPRSKVWNVKQIITTTNCSWTRNPKGLKANTFTKLIDHHVKCIKMAKRIHTWRHPKCKYWQNSSYHLCHAKWREREMVKHHS